MVTPYAAALPTVVATPTELAPDSGERERRAAYWLTLDAINFGSGWFPTLNKRPGESGYFTIAEGLRRRFERRGAWSAAELLELTPAELAAVFGQAPEHELMELFAQSLRQLGERLEQDHGGSFAATIDAAGASALGLVELLASWRCFSDSSLYDGRPVPFLTRAQIAAADLARAGVARFDDLAQLTMFADNLVPHVLRLDRVLSFSPELVARIDGEQLLAHGSAEEVEIRACAVHAVELIVAASPLPRTAAAIDQLLWNRGQQLRYKARPRHRSRCTAY
jgi:hypothetical protein